MKKQNKSKENAEIEIQVKIDGIDKLLKHLKNKAQYISAEWQKDIYFSPSDSSKSFLNKTPVDEWLRVRYEDSKTSVTYKNFHREKSGFAKFCDEYNTDIKDGKQMEKVFLALGFVEIITVDKKRKTYMDGDFEISIDDIKNLGRFVEVEYKGKKSKEKYLDIKSSMVQYLKDKGCTNIVANNGGYPFMILFPKKVKTTLL